MSGIMVKYMMGSIPKQVIQKTKKWYLRSIDLTVFLIKL